MIKTPVAALLTAACLAFGALMSPTPAVAQIELTVMIAPPPLPVYEQPPIPGPGYLWVPGYWSYGPYGYFWVPGTWMEPPQVGLLWTPGYWGGEWRDNHFWYNREVNNVTNVNITNVYNRTVVNNTTVNRISYVGGPGGLTAQPSAEEERVAHEHRIPATPVQVQHRESAATRPELVASVNHGKPAIAATARPGAFESHVVSASRAGGPVTVHAQDLPKPQAAPPASKPVANQAPDYQRQETEMHARQQQEREQLAQMQERDHAYFNQQSANAHAQAQMEHQHLQQTQFLQQRQAAEMQNMHAAPPHAPAPPPHAPAPAHGPPPRQ